MNSRPRNPQVEAIFEIWWQLKPVAPGIFIDPHYKLLVGRLYDKLDGYPFHEPLPTSAMPDQIVVYTVQHRFRQSEGGWPLVQIGPGILTLNDTEKYEWDDFKARIPQVLKALFAAYPKGELTVNRVLFRCVNAIDFDYDENDISVFLRDMMGTEMKVPQSLFNDTGVRDRALAIDLRFGFPSSKPAGAINLRFTRGLRFTQGQKNKTDAFFWETTVQSTEKDAPKTQRAILKWVEKAHFLTDDWLSKLPSAELLRTFE
jgi:uncharacterized protein (TIGR04255 family)